MALRHTPRFKTKASSAPVPGVANSTVMNLHESDNRGGINVQTYNKEHLLTFVLFVCFVVVMFLFCFDDVLLSLGFFFFFTGWVGGSVYIYIYIYIYIYNSEPGTKSVVCSGSRVTNSTVMKLHRSDNRGRIAVKTFPKSTCSHL